MLWIVVIFKFVVCNEWIVVLCLELGFLIVILIVFNLCFIVVFVVVFVVIWVVKGVDFLFFLKFNELVDDYVNVFLWVLVIMMIVLLNVEWICVIFVFIFFFIWCLWFIFFVVMKF